MNALHTFTPLAVGLLAAVISPRAVAAEPEPEVARGRIVGTDAAKGRLIVRTAGSGDLTLAVTPKSRLAVDGKPVALADLSAGRQVRVTYREGADGAKELVSLRSAVVTDGDLKREVSQALAATKQYTFQRKAEYAARVRGVVDDLDDRIDALEAEAKDAGADAKKRLEPRLAELKKRRAVLADRLWDVRSVAADTWEDVKSGFGAAARDLERLLGD